MYLENDSARSRNEFLRCFFKMKSKNKATKTIPLAHTEYGIIMHASLAIYHPTGACGLIEYTVIDPQTSSSCSKDSKGKLASELDRSLYLIGYKN